MERLISIILYTDYSSLSCNFTTTFRRRNAFETIESVKKRHMNHHWWSKLLKQTVEVYGKKKNEGLLGPFYCGMSSVMNMTQFAIQLLSPTSTSVHLEVAMNFSGEEGIIIEFDNSIGWGYQVYGLDVSFISRCKEEDERYVVTKK